MHLIANTKAPVIAADNSVVIPKHSLLSTGSLCFEAVYSAWGKKSVDILKAEPAAILFINNAYKHCKTIGIGKQRELFIGLTNVKNL